MRYAHPITKKQAIQWEGINSNMYYVDWFPAFTLWELEAYGFVPVEENDWLGLAFTHFCDNTTFEWEEGDYKVFCEAIEKHQPKENVCNLVPLDTESITKELMSLFFHDEYGHACTSISNMLEKINKYGTTPQKKWTRREIYDYCCSVFSNQTDAEIHIYSFLKNNNLLED